MLEGVGPCREATNAYFVGSTGFLAVRGGTWVVSVVIALLVPGCASPAPDTGREGLVAFMATYETTQETAKGLVEGVLHMSLDGPFSVADRDLVVRPAHRLSVIWDRRLQDGPNWTNLGPLAMNYYVDGSFRVVRTEDPEVDARLRHASWDMQGAPLPLGVALQLLPTDSVFVIEGRAVPATVVVEDGWKSLAGFDVIPLDELLDFGFRARYRGPADIVPDTFEMRGPTPASTIFGKFAGMFVQQPLPNLDSWPVLHYAEERPGRELWKVLPGEWEDPMAAGVTLEALVEELVRQEPEAGVLLDDGCLAFAALLPGGGDNGIGVGPIRLLRTTTLHFALTFQLDGGRLRNYDIEHTVSAEPSTSVHVTEYSVPSPMACLQRDHAAPWTLLDEMRAGYELPLVNSGVPCGATHGPQLVTNETELIVKGSIDHFSMAFTDTNDASTAIGSLAWLEWDEEAAGWDTIIVHHLDMETLDSGVWEPRAVPQMTLDDLQPRVHCVAPTPTEVPVTA